MGKQVGLDMKLYRATGSPAWNLIDNVRDLTGPDSFSEADVSCRAVGIKLTEPALRDISFEWEMVYDETDTDFTTLRTAYAAKTLVEFALADGLIGTAGTTGSGGVAGSKYIRVECKIFKFERNEALEGANLYSVVAKPCYSSAAAPTIATVS
jgi:hypothetical protein